MRFFFLSSCFFLCVCVYSNAQIDDKHLLPYMKLDLNNWADSVMGNMSIDQKIGQMFMVAANGKNLSQSYYKKVDSLIINYNLGGLIFFQSSPSDLKTLITRYNKLSQFPLIYGLDAEWGAAMRLDSVQPFPWMMTLGAIQKNDLIYQFAEEVAMQLKHLGIHINFAPVVDINNNPQNPIIDRRSFSSSKYVVSEKSLLYMKGLQDNNILACAKHFPGHGDTNIDSHKSLPIINHNFSRLDSIELYPFKELINNGVGSVMVAHMNLPHIDTLGIPSSFSKYLISDILKNKLDFNGIVISDALNMKALSNYKTPGERELNAFIAGNDILLYPDNILEAIRLIKSSVIKDSLLMEQLDSTCKKILILKKWVGLFQESHKVKVEFDLQSEKSKLLNKKLCKSAITVLKNTNNLPLNNFDSLKIACLSMGEGDGGVFYNRLNTYFPIDRFFFNNKNQDQKHDVIEKLSSYDIVIVGLHYLNNNFWDKHLFNDYEDNLIKKISKNSKIIFNVFGHPRVINSLSDSYVDALILSYQNSSIFQDLTAQLIFGSISSDGRLPVELNSFSEGSGLKVEKFRKIEFIYPLEAKMSQLNLNKIDSIVNYAIDNKMMPGCQVLVSRFGKVLFQKSYGHHTYNLNRPVENHHIYDIASITKIVSAAPILMSLYEERKINLNKKLKRYSILFKNSDKSSLKIIDILTHQSRLHPWIPFYQNILDKQGHLDSLFVSTEKSYDYSIEVAKNIFLSNTYVDSIMDQIVNYPLLNVKEYKYSDLGFYILQYILENKFSIKIDKYIDSKIFNPLGCYRITYNPLKVFHDSLVVPTEHDHYFRKQLIHGHVHDQGAALFGGIALHAGLFSNSLDLMKVMQLYLDNGKYMGDEIFSKKTIAKFTSSPNEKIGNRRGIIFDKPSLNMKENGPTFSGISRTSFGHSGFTGTLVWADPSTEIIYVFLSNGRVYPDGNNTSLIQNNIRTDIQKIIYESIID